MNQAWQPPYRIAALVALAVLVGYVITLAPTVTFWDAGELVAAAYSLGIPHPPGTPLWVLVAHVWGKVVPFGDYAWRLNLMSAIGGAVSAGLWFLVGNSLVRRLDRAAPAYLAIGGGVAAALCSAFGFTNWQNANEAEVYSIAMVTIAAAAWCVVRWCDQRDTRHGQRLMLVLLYLGAISIGNHLLALLVGPALVALLAAESWRDPLLDPTRRDVERSRIAVIGATWLMLIAVGLGNTTLMMVFALPLLAAVGLALTRRQLVFIAATLIIVAVGISPYLFLYLRAQQGPFINEADPSTWNALLDVIRRAQYPIRTPLDDPTVVHGPGNPGRSLTILGYQLANYGQYFDWQWARGLGNGAFTTPLRLLVTLLALSTGIHGALTQWRRDRSGFWFVATFFAVTGIGLVLYMNFKPGPSIGWDRWAQQGDHEVRERDYFFVASFVAWSVWIGIGLAAIASELAARFPGRAVTRAVFAISLIPFVANFTEASRRHGPDATLARDFARALLDSVPPGGILFTWGDNDTFPLWHAQVVDGYRTDVTIVCLALAETNWYQRQVRDHRPAGVDYGKLPAVWRDHPAPDPELPIHDLDDATIATLRPQLADQDYELPLATGGRLAIPKGTVLAAKDIAMFSILRSNVGKRPVAWAITTRRKLFDAPVIQQGLAYVLPVKFPELESVAPGGEVEPPMDLGVTRGLIDNQWSLGGLLEADLSELEPNVASMAHTMALPHARAGLGMLERGDTTEALRLLRRAAHLSVDNQPLRQFISDLERQVR